MAISSGAQESQELVLLIPGPYGLGPVDFEVNYFLFILKFGRLLPLGS